MPYDRSAFVTRTPVENVCFDYMQDATQFVADWLFTPKPVKKAETKIYQADLSKLRVADDAKGTNAEPNLIDEQLFSTNITLKEYKLGSEINPRDEQDADLPVMLGDARKAKIVTNNLLMAREARAVTLATTTGNYPAALTSGISSGSRWNEAGGDPESDMVTVKAAMRKSCGREPNALLIDITTFDKLKLSPHFRERTKYTNGGPITEDIIRAYFGVQYLVVGRAYREEAAEGETSAVASFWGSNAIAFVYNPSPAIESVSYGHMYLINTPFWSRVDVDTKRTGARGSMRRVTVGTEYVLGPGYVPASGDSDFAAGYLLTTVVA